jgi:predicted nucleotidyltransferase component of viral defense system
VNKIRGTVALERIVARLRASKFLRDKIVFCGGFVLYKEGLTQRYTRDVDMISGVKDHEGVINGIKSAIVSDIGDGFWFGDVQVEEIQDDINYGGFRFKPLFKVGTPFPESDKDLKKLRRIHVDLSFQNLLDDMRQNAVLEDELGFYEKLTWEIYPIEYIVSDKLHATIARAGLSTRSKDIYDISKIVHKCSREKLKTAVEYTFRVRGEPLKGTIVDNLKSLDTGPLKSNWKKVENFGGDESFEECWKVVIKFFEKF